MDPAPSIDAETVAVYLHQHAKTAAQRTAVLVARLRAEEAAEAAAIAETEIIQAELEQYNGWMEERLEGGANYIMSKQLHEERNRRSSLADVVADLRGRLVGLSGDLQVLVGESQETLEQRQVRAADEALSALERLQRINEAATAREYREG